LLNNKIFEAIFLIHISIDVLLHCFLRKFWIFASFIKFYFLTVYVLNCVFELLKSDIAMLYETHIGRHILSWRQVLSWFVFRQSRWMWSYKRIVLLGYSSIVAFTSNNSFLANISLNLLELGYCSN
jgi:hypothetical protein